MPRIFSLQLGVNLRTAAPQLFSDNYLYALTSRFALSGE